MAAAISESTPRRVALRLLGATGLATIASRLGDEEADGRKKKKKRCRTRRQTCGGKKKCCGADTACREFPTATCSSFTGRLCCGLEGAVCDKSFGINACDCCDGLFCGGVSGVDPSDGVKKSRRDSKLSTRATLR